MAKNPPAPPDPIKTANAQTQSNKDTAIAQTTLNNTNQITPFGSLTYEQTGELDGVPQFTATQSLSPELQGISDNLMGGAGTLAANLNTQAATPLDWSGQQDFLNSLTDETLNPVWERKREDLYADLNNRGIGMGSTGYTRAFEDFDRAESKAYNDARLGNYGTALSSALALRNQPINELSALLSGTQVAQPSFTSTPQTGVAGTDIAGITQQGYANQVNAYNQNQAQMGGLFGTVGNVASAALPFILSDERAKDDIEKVGETDDGQNIYSYTYKGDPSGKTHMGLMAQEVMKKKPEAVVKMGSMFGVDYSKALEAA